MHQHSLRRIPFDADPIQYAHVLQESQAVIVHVCLHDALGSGLSRHLAHSQLYRPSPDAIFLGVTEAPYYPGALYMLLLFYTRKEIATRLSILYSGNILATSFSGLIAAATFATLDNVHGLAGWRWLFIIEGIVTFGVALVGMYLLPDFPLTTRWLTPDERQMAHDRILRDTVGMAPSKGARAGFAQAIRDPRLYLLCLMQNMHLSACSFNNFFPTVVGSLGSNRNHHPGSDLPAISPLRCRRHHSWLHFRQIQRANLAHHGLDGCRFDRLHHFLRHP